MGFQNDLVFARGMEFQATHPIQIGDDRTVGADEFFFAEIAFEIGKRAAQDVRLRADVHAGVVAGGLDPVDIRNIQKYQFAAAFDRQALHALRRCRRVVRNFVLARFRARTKRASSNGFSR